MAIATGTALAIGLGAQAAGGLVKSKLQSNAAKKAAKEQAQATQESNRYMQQGLGQLGQLYSPYINAGAGAQGTLGRLTTPGPGARFASPGPPNAMPQPPNPYQAMPRGPGGPPQGWQGYGPMGMGGGQGYGGPMGPYPAMPPGGGPFGGMGQRMPPPQMPPPGYYQ